MAHTIPIPAEERPLGRKSVLKAVRRSGKVPAVLYGRGIEPRPLQLPARELETVLRRHGHSVILELQLNGERMPALIKEIELHKLTGHVNHLGLQNIRMTDTISTTVPIVFVGTATAVENANGMLEQTLAELPVTGRADRLPETLQVDISSMQMGDTLRVSDVPLSEGITTTADPDQVIATTTVSAAARQEAAEAEAAAEAAEAAAPAEAEAKGGEAAGS